MRTVFILLGALFGGIGLIIIVLMYRQHQINLVRQRLGVTGLGATAGGLTELFNTLGLVVFLTTIIGLGIYAVIKSAQRT